MSDPTPNETPSEPADQEPVTPPKKEQTDWRVVVIIGVAVLLLLAAYVNRKFYHRKPEVSTRDNQPAARAAESAPAAPAPSIEEQYKTLRTDREAELLNTVFTLDGRPLLLASLPAVMPPAGPSDRLVSEPGILFDLARRAEGIEPADFQRRGYLNGMAYMNSFPPLGLTDEPKLVVRPDADVPLNIIGDNYRVIGVVVGGEARAYPIWLANYHEVINDTLGGKEIVVAWSAMAMAAEAFERPMTDGRTARFGSAGLLYQAAILIYDAPTRSLWSPTFARCVTGPLTGTPLTPVPAFLSTWKEWKRLHPAGSALVGADPVFRLQYNANPAVPSNYYGDSSILYPVKGLDLNGVMPAKAAVIGVTAPDGRAKAYVLGFLKEMKGPFEDAIGGAKVLLEYDAPAEILSAKTESGQVLRCETMLWMAWVGAHPDTEVWETERLHAMMHPAPQPGPDTAPASAPPAP